MSLLPIIYKSLIIFSSLAFIVITISFIISKFNTKREEESEFNLQPMLSKNLKQSIIKQSPYHTHIGYNEKESAKTQIDHLINNSENKERKIKPRKEMTDYEIMSYYFG